MLKDKNVSIPLWYQCKIRSEYHIYDFKAPFKVIRESSKACVVSCICSHGDFTFWVPKSIITIDNVCYVNQQSDLEVVKELSKIDWLHFN